jgi:hypothetical protein
VDEAGRSLGRGDAERVHDGDLGCARLDRGLIGASEELAVGARGVDAEEAHPDAVLARESNRLRDALQHRLAGDAQRPQLPVGDGALDHRCLDAKLDECLDVGRHGAGEPPHLRAEPRRGDQLDSSPVVLRHPREPRLDAVDARGVERAGDLELVLGREDDADRLLAVAQRRVVEADRDGGLRPERPLVDVAGPDETAVDGHAGTPTL